MSLYLKVKNLFLAYTFFLVLLSTVYSSDEDQVALTDNVIESPLDTAREDVADEGLDPALKNIMESAEGLDPALYNQPGRWPGAKTVIALVQDGPIPLAETLYPLLKEELDELLGKGNYELRNTDEFNAQWVYEQAEETLKRALNDPEIDMILALGLNVISAASDPSLALEKPVIGVDVLRSTVWGKSFMREDGRSGKRNLVFNVLPNGAVQDLLTFQKLVNFKKAYVLVGKSAAGSKELLQKAIEDVEKQVDFDIGVIIASDTVKETVDTIGAISPEAIYLSPLAHFTIEELEALYAEINKLGIPSFSMLGQVMVEKGVLAAQSSLNPQGIARRVALNIYTIKEGSAPEELSAIISIDSNLVINAVTAKKIEFYPEFSTLMTADYIYQENLFEGKELFIEEAIKLAGENNVSVQIEMATTRRNEAEKNITRSDLLPQITVNTSYNIIDRDRAASGAIPRWEHTAGATARQLLFSNQVISDYRASISSYLSQQALEMAVRLDAANDGAQDYLNLLLARALLRVELANLKLTRSNLHLAKMREMAGTAGPEEVLRWESEEANAQTDVLEAEELTKTALITLNQTLNQDQQTEWMLDDINLEDKDMYFLDNKLLEIVSNAGLLRHFRTFSVRKALELSPSLQAIDKAISGQEITLNERRQSFYLPEISAEFNFERSLDADYRTGRRPAGLDEDEWSALLVAELPLFEGWRRPSEVNRERSELERLIKVQIETVQLIELNTRNAIFAIENSFPSIRLTRISLNRSQRNLDLVRDKYVEGKVGVTDLIDAQETSLGAQRGAVQATYVFLGDLYNYQRAISWFEAQKSVADKNLFIRQLEEFLESKRTEKSTNK
ncbi:MAG: TolC family protein [Verrucomicrobiota bacterium]